MSAFHTHPRPAPFALTRRLALCALAALLSTLAAASARGQTLTPAQQEVRAVQDALIDAYTHRDPGAIDRILADDYTFVLSNGAVYTKKQIVDGFSAGGDRTITSYQRDEEAIRVYGDFAVMTYRYTSRESFQGHDESGTFRLTRIFARRDGRWQVIGGQENRIAAPVSTPAARFVGTWRLVSGGDLRPDGSLEPFKEYGPHPLGYIMYDATGHMCASLANPNHPLWADPNKPTQAELARAGERVFVYCGPYEVREKEGRVIHRPEFSSWPGYAGTDQSRNYRFENDLLILSGEASDASGQPSSYRITWQRVPPN